MAFTYKSIGNTAAAVVSLLAVGTLCWWQRTPGPIDAPRPQDEAEIMTAILERHYAMGRTTTKFTQTRAAYVSQVPDTNAVGGVRYVTNSAAYTLTNTIGFFPNATFAYPQSIRDALQPGTGAYGGANACVWLVPSNSYWTAGVTEWKWDATMLTAYLHTQTNWWTNYVTLSTATRLTTAFTNIPSTNLSVRTGWRATSTLSDGAIYYVKDYTDNVFVSWPKDFVFSGTAPDEFYYGANFQIDDIFGGGESIGFYWSELNWIGMDMPDAIKWIAEGPMTYFSSSLPAYLTCSFGSGDVTIEYGTWTNVTVVEPYLVTNVTQSNTWLGKVFAFERDGKSYTWSTNAYNDMARALSFMQWQKNEASIACCTQTTIQMYRSDSSQSVGPFSYSFITNFASSSPEYGGYYPSTIFFNYQLDQDGTTFDWMRTDDGVWAGGMLGGIKCWKYGITNNTPFAWTNIQLFTSISTNNNYIAAGATWTPTNLYNTIVTITNYLPAGASALSGWIPFSPEEAVDFLKTNMIAWSDNALPWSYVPSGWGNPGPFLMVNENQAYDVGERNSEVAQGYLPYVNVIPSSQVIAYHVQFSALTNYLNHAPAR